MSERYKIYNAIRAFEGAVAIAASQDIPETDDAIQIVKELFAAFALELDTHWQRNGLDKLDTAPPAAAVPAAAPAASNGYAPKPTVAEQGGVPGQQGSKGLTPATTKFIAGLIPKAQKNGYTGPINTPEDVAKRHDFKHRDAIINLLRLYAFYNGNIAEYDADADNATDYKGNPAVRPLGFGSGWEEAEAALVG